MLGYSTQRLSSISLVKLFKRNVKHFSDRSAETHRITEAISGSDGLKIRETAYEVLVTAVYIAC